MSSSGSEYSAFNPQEENILYKYVLHQCLLSSCFSLTFVISSQYFASNKIHAQSRGDLQVDAEIETSFSSALSEPPNINWDDVGAWNYDTTIHDGRSTIAVAPILEYSNLPNLHATPHPSRLGILPPVAQIPLKFWNFNHQLPIRQSHSTYTTPSEEVSFVSSGANNAVDHISSSTNYQPDYNRTIHHLYSITASPVISQKPSSFPERKTKSKPKPKNLHCPNCDRSFARAPDLQRHIDGIHLRIRHHCRVIGCGDNLGKGYCRMEKLRNHMMSSHDRV